MIDASATHSNTELRHGGPSIIGRPGAAGGNDGSTPRVASKQPAPAPHEARAPHARPFNHLGIVPEHAMQPTDIMDVTETRMRALSAKVRVSKAQHDLRPRWVHAAPQRLRAALWWYNGTMKPNEGGCGGPSDVSARRRPPRWARRAGLPALRLHAQPPSRSLNLRALPDHNPPKPCRFMQTHHAAQPCGNSRRSTFQLLARYPRTTDADAACC
jgi:hypothetical protein